MNNLETQNLTLAYDDHIVIRGLNLKIPAGRITVLIGANGCGKSTLLRGMARLLQLRGGSVYLNGKDIQSLPTKQIARQLGILPQGPSALEGLTVRELVMQGRYPYRGLLRQWSAQDEYVTAEALAITTMTDLAERPLETLSGGQRQRAWIAMALAQDTDILLLDEPTTFLDLAHQVDVLDLLHTLNVEGRTIVLVLHDLNQACRYADHLVALKDGQIYAQGNPAQIVTPELVNRVFGLQCQIIADPVTGTPLCVPLTHARRLPATEPVREDQQVAAIRQDALSFAS